MRIDNLAELLFQDPEFVVNYSVYHPDVENDIDSVVLDYWNRIKNTELYQTEYGFYGIDKQKDVVPWLAGFFIAPSMRNKETVVKFWNDVETQLGSCFLTGVYTKNIKAVDFLKKHGKIMKQNEIETVFYFTKSRGL